MDWFVVYVRTCMHINKYMYMCIIYMHFHVDFPQWHWYIFFIFSKEFCHVWEFRQSHSQKYNEEEKIISEVCPSSPVMFPSFKKYEAAVVLPLRPLSP